MVNDRSKQRIQRRSVSKENNDQEDAVKRVGQIKKKVKNQLKKLPNVTGVGVGYRILRRERTKEICIRVYVRKKVPLNELDEQEVIPPEVEGIRTDVIEGKFHIQGPPVSSFQSRRNPLIGGLSIINTRIPDSAGTLGGTVFDNITRKDMILSNWHVLCWIGCEVGDYIIQPGSFDGGTNSDVVATLFRSRLTSRVDAAIAVLTGERFLDQQVLGFRRFEGINDPTLGMSVKKGGRTTGNTTGQIVDVSADINIEGYPTGTRTFTNQLVIETGTNQPFSQRGDSGSLILDNQNQVVGLLFAGNGNQTIANKISDVINALDIDIDQGLTLHDSLGVMIQTLL